LALSARAALCNRIVHPQTWLEISATVAEPPSINADADCTIDAAALPVSIDSLDLWLRERRRFAKEAARESGVDERIGVGKGPVVESCA
jgi:hypothetical protein